MDKRKNNGGHSTKTKGVDKRKNDYKKIVKEVVTDEELKKVILMILDKAITHKDIQAAKIILEYTLGKPDSSVDVTTDGEKITTPPVLMFGDKPNEQ